MTLRQPHAYTETMNPTGSSAIQQAIAASLAARPYSHRQDVSADAAAVITVEEDLRFLPDTLRAVLAQSVLPGTIVIVDCSGDTSRSMVTDFSVIPSPAGPISSVPEAKTVTVQVVGAKGASSFGDAVAKGLSQARLPGQVRALWLLHDDSRPADDECLSRLLDTWRNNPTASLLGAKQLDWEGSSLHDVGLYAGHHRLESLVVDGEEDQEQYDARQDVFAVSLAGALLPIETLHALGGVNRWFTTFAESADFCRRVCLNGGRVVVVPSARIAHRRARFEGIRTRGGAPVDERGTIDTAMTVMDCAQRYRYTDTRLALWPLIWLWSLIGGIGRSLAQLFSKKPYEAWCELCMPWRALASLPGGIAARRLVSRQTNVPPMRLTALSVNRQQLRQWHDRRQALDDQRRTVLLGPLARAHLRARRIRRWSLALGMALASFLVVAIVYRQVFAAVFSGGSLYSDQLLPTSADLGQLADSATTLWVFGAGTGVPAPPAPWLLVWLAVSVVTAGHTTAALALIFFAAAPLAALSFWALAGVFTRSDAVRVVGGLLWVALGLAMGLFDAANLPMLTVMVFLPAAFAFAFRAVGLYHTEDQLHPHRSVQAAALASLCFIPVVAAEPQLLLPLIVTFLVFLIFVPRHRVMLLLMPVPAAFVVSPTLVNAVRYARDGAWRQLFGDVMVPSRQVNGGPGAVNLADVTARAFGLDAGGGIWPFGSDPHAIAIVAVCALLAILAVVALCLPFALRVARMMWVVSLTGAALAICCSRVAIAADLDGDVAASVLPGFTMMLLGFMSCICVLAGGAVKRFVPLRVAAGAAADTSAGTSGAAHASRRAVAGTRPASAARTSAVGTSAARTKAVHLGRALLVAALALCTVATGGVALIGPQRRSVAVSRSGLPMVAVDYLQQGDDHRILALRAASETDVEFTVMRTMRGDLVDSSPLQRVRLAFEGNDDADATIAAAGASLLSGADSQAIAQISRLGFGGIFVASSGGDAATAGEQLQSNVTASEGTQSVVANDSGTYYRLTINSADSQNIDTSWQRRTQSSQWRYAWLWCMGVIVTLYCLVALPRRSYRYYREES